MKLYFLGLAGLLSINSFASEKQPTYCEIYDPQTQQLMGDLKINWNEKIDGVDTGMQKTVIKFTGSFHTGEYGVVFNRKDISTRCAVQKRAFGTIPDFGKLSFAWDSDGYLDCETFALEDYGIFESFDGKITELKCI